MPSKLQVVGIYRKKVHRFVGGAGALRTRVLHRGYALLTYGDKEIGRVAISDEIYESMRADGQTVLLNGGRK